jgi:hypothetical protein
MNLKIVTLILEVLLNWITNRWLTVKDPAHLDRMSLICDSLSSAKTGVDDLIKDGARVTQLDKITVEDTPFLKGFESFIHTFSAGSAHKSDS